MERFLERHKKMLLVLGLLLLAAALVWAAAELSGQANALAQDAGDSSADMEMVSLDTIKPAKQTKDTPQPPPCDWAKEKALKQKLNANNAQYKQLRAKAKSELQGTGQVSPGTKSAVMASAKEFKSLSDQYAAMWDACKCKTRANTARKSGNSRLKSAAVLVGGDINEGLLTDMQSAQQEMKAARREYVREATEGGELSDQDMADLSATVVPQAKQVAAQVQQLVNNVTSLLGNLQSSAGDAAKAALSKVATGGGAAGAKEAAASELLKPVKTLLGVSQNMLTNATALVEDAIGLATGKAPSMAGLAETAGKMAPCFIESAEEE
ncbi:MAG: hypothetical protein AB1896_03595 [Thermodesulfobacteriota bacterium]